MTRDAGDLRAFASSDPRHDPNNCPACEARERGDSVFMRLEALRGDLSPAIPDPYSAKGQPLPVDPCPVSGPMAGIVSPVVQDELHLNYRTTTRGFTYDLATLLGEGHYEEDPP